MRSLLIVVLLACLGALPGCSLLFSNSSPAFETEYYAVSSDVVPQWRGTERESIEHLRLRLWLIDAASESSLRNTFNPRVKIVRLNGDLGHGLESRFMQSDRDEPPLSRTRTVGLLQHLGDDTVEAVLFEGASAVWPTDQYHYAVFYGDRGEIGALWSAVGGFVPVSIPSGTYLRSYIHDGGLVASIPGEVIVAKTGDGLLAMDWNGHPISDSGWPEGFEADAVYPVLDDSAILVVHGDTAGPPELEAGASLWRPSSGLHHVTTHEGGWVLGPSNAYYGFTAQRDRVYKLQWSAGGKPTARRVLPVSGLSRTVSSMSPDGRFVVSGGPDIKGVRNFGRIHEVHEKSDRIWRNAQSKAWVMPEPIWLCPKFGAPTSIKIVPRPDWIRSADHR